MRPNCSTTNRQPGLTSCPVPSILRPIMNLHFGFKRIALVVASASMGLSIGFAADLSKGLLLVANKGDHTLGIIDPVAGRQIAVVPEDGNTGHEVAASPDGKRAFVPI